MWKTSSNRAPERLHPGPASQLLGDRIDHRHLAGFVRGENSVPNAAQRRGKPVLRLSKPLLGIAPGGQVASDLGETSEHPRVVANGSDDHVGPEARAVFSDTPTFGLHATVAQRGIQKQPRHPPCLVLGRVEHGKVSSDNLVGLVPLDEAGTLVPRHDVPVGVEHEDGVVADALHHEAELGLRHQGWF